MIVDGARLKLSPFCASGERLSQFPRPVQDVRFGSKAQVTPGNRRLVHLEATADGQNKLTPIFVNKDRFCQKLTYFLHHLRARANSRGLVFVPITKRGKANEASLTAYWDNETLR